MSFFSYLLDKFDTIIETNIRKVWALIFMPLGFGLVFEHVMSGSFEFFDFLGHEWLGVYLMVLGVFPSVIFNLKKWMVKEDE